MGLAGSAHTDAASVAVADKRAVANACVRGCALGVGMARGVADWRARVVYYLEASGTQALVHLARGGRLTDDQVRPATYDTVGI
jgi:hypothetical protein